MWQASFTVPAAAVGPVLEQLEDEGTSVAAFEVAEADGEDAATWRVELLYQGRPEPDSLALRLREVSGRTGLGALDPVLEPVPERDWLESTARQFPPQQVGAFWIHGSHVDELPPRGAIDLLIDAGLAFGSGEHATTRSCLLALDRLASRRRPRRVLDLGCGSGILAIAAARRWPCRVVAADHDPQAVATAAINAARNGVPQRVRCLASNGLANPRLRALGPYDLVLANILAEPLRAMARDIAQVLAPRAVVALSGLLRQQAPALEAAYRMRRLRRLAVIEDGPWSTLVMGLRRGRGEGRRSTLLTGRMLVG